ncbi:hypothetical protein [Candidatus Methylacidithermus pantelleriae]|uniref:hypothetical protein n=1 Tax=Candidatus Methylacidithermus pantelleriae TaxID=2744239 RepID=UPI00157CA9B2|nr:hypothetical protein [Candidatus Methylacidithermus pantelleriae]
MAELCGVQAKELEEPELYRAMDGWSGVWSRVKKKLYGDGPLPGTSLVLYDLSRVYLEGGWAGGVGPLRTLPGSPRGSESSVSSGLRAMLEESPMPGEVSAGKPGRWEDSCGVAPDTPTTVGDPTKSLCFRWRREQSRRNLEPLEGEGPSPCQLSQESQSSGSDSRDLPNRPAPFG